MKREHSDERSSSGPGNDGGGGGMSRAAKKRAKKKEKKINETDDNVVVSKVVGAATGTTPSNESKTNQQRAPPPSRKAASACSVPSSKPAMVPTTEREVHDDTSGSSDTLTLQLPLVQLLLVDNSNSNNNNEEVNPALHDLTVRDRARLVLGAMLAPTVTCDEFYNEYWEKKPLLVRAATSGGTHNNKNRFDHLLSLASIKKLLHDESKTLYYGRDLNVARYVEDPSSGIKRRITLDPQVLPSSTGTTTTTTTQGEPFVSVEPNDVWSNFENGCTIRLLCPQRFVPSVHSLLSFLELEWGCMVGANAYLTPPNANQGFAPHYDDIEAFCLQLEGQKRWKVYKPPRDDVLPRYSSPDFTEQDLYDMGNPIMDEILEPGDLLYMPRGWIHQACTLPSRSSGTTDATASAMHSLHLTVSAMQQWAWVDFLEIAMPAALEAASMESISLREGLPRCFLDYMGAMHDVSEDELPESLKSNKVLQPPPANDDDVNNGDSLNEETTDLQQRRQKQELFRLEAKRRIMLVAQKAINMVDTTCDQIGKRFLSDRLPPALTTAEAVLTHRASSSNPPTSSSLKITASSLCRLARPGIARLVLEDEKAVIYHCADNSCLYHDRPLEPLEFEMDDAAALEQLLTTVEPHWICVKDLFHDEIQDKVEIAQALYKEGILAVRS